MVAKIERKSFRLLYFLWSTNIHIVRSTFHCLHLPKGKRRKTKMTWMCSFEDRNRFRAFFFVFFEVCVSSFWNTKRESKDISIPFDVESIEIFETGEFPVFEPMFTVYDRICSLTVVCLLICSLTPILKKYRQVSFWMT